MEAQVEERGDVIIVRFSGRVDAASAPQFEKQIHSIIDLGHFKFVLNFAEVDYLSSAGMRLMLSLSKKLERLEGKMVICCLGVEVQEVVRMAGFHQILECYNTEEESLKHV